MSSASPAPAAATPAAAATPRGAFILLEGLDRSGKTSQCVTLARELNKANKDSALQMRFPDRTTAIGQMIDAYLKQSAEIDDRAIHLLFSANRWEAQSTLMSALARGQHVVMDRYAYSGIAFSHSKVDPCSPSVPRLSLEWCCAPDRGLPAPDAVLFLDISSEDAAKRGAFGEERYEKKDIQDRVRAVFEKLRLQASAPPAAASTVPAAAGAAAPAAAAAEAGSTFGQGVEWSVINAGQSVEQVQAELMALTQKTIARVAKEQLPIKFL